MKRNITATFLCLMLLAPLTIKADSTVINNSVSVSATSGNGGQNTAYIKTINNGEVVEDFYISTTTDFIYQSEHTINKTNEGDLVKQTEIKNDTFSFSAEKNTQQLTLLLNNLLILLDYYEKLLDKQ